MDQARELELTQQSSGIGILGFRGAEHCYDVLEQLVRQERVKDHLKWKPNKRLKSSESGLANSRDEIIQSRINSSPSKEPEIKGKRSLDCFIDMCSSDDEIVDLSATMKPNELKIDDKSKKFVSPSTFTFTSSSNDDDEW